MFDEEPPPYHRGPRTGSVILVSILTSALTSAGVVYGLREWEARRAGGGAAETMEVPAVTGMAVEQARALLDSKGLILTLEAEREDSSVAPGAIVSQAPLAGSRARKGSEVRAVVARGMAQVDVPELAGLTLEEAGKKLGTARLTVGTATRTPDPKVPVDRVVSTKPPAGTKVSAETAVDVLVSSGPGEVEVPKVTGMGLRKAKEALAAAGFELGSTITTYDEDRGPYVILKQDPAAGAKAPRGTKINLVVNEGE